MTDTTDTKKRRARPEPEAQPEPAPSIFADLSDKDVAKLIRVIGNAPDADLAWLGRRITSATERWKIDRHKPRPPKERHGGREYEVV